MKLKQLFESTFPTSREEVEAILKKYDLTKYATSYIVNSDLSVDGNVDLFNKKFRSASS